MCRRICTPHIQLTRTPRTRAYTLDTQVKKHMEQAAAHTYVCTYIYVYTYTCTHMHAYAQLTRTHMHVLITYACALLIWLYNKNTILQFENVYSIE